MKKILILLTALASLTIASTAEAQIFTCQQLPQATQTVVELNSVTGANIMSIPIAGFSCNPVGSFGNVLYASIGGAIASYNTSTGQVINPSLVTGLRRPLRVIVSGNNLFVSDAGLGTVSEYNATTGAPINLSFATFPAGGVEEAWPIAISGDTLFLLTGSTAENSITDPLNTSVINEYDINTGSFNRKYSIT